MLQIAVSNIKTRCSSWANTWPTQLRIGDRKEWPTRQASSDMHSCFMVCIPPESLLGFLPSPADLSSIRAWVSKLVSTCNLFNTIYYSRSSALLTRDGFGWPLPRCQGWGREQTPHPCTRLSATYPDVRQEPKSWLSYCCLWILVLVRWLVVMVRWQ